MSSSSMTESYQSSDRTCEPDIVALNAKIMAVMDGSEELQMEIEKMTALQQSVYDYKKSHVNRMERTKEKIVDMSRELAITGKSLVNLCNDHLVKINNITEPYINSGLASQEPEGPTIMERCIQLIGKIQGLETLIRKTEDVSSSVLEHHKNLNSIESKLADAMNRHKTAIGIQRISLEHPSGDPLHHLSGIPKLFLALNQSANVSSYYKKEFKSFGCRVTSLFAELNQPGPLNVNGNGSFLTTLSSISNGEIDLKSITDHSEVPIDSCQTAKTSD